jgi:hypothetical protein
VVGAGGKRVFGVSETVRVFWGSNIWRKGGCKMPELPEVEAAKRLVSSHCLGGTIVKAIVDNDTKVVDGLTPAALQEALEGKKIISAHRRGKHMWLQLNCPRWPTFQFGAFSFLYTFSSTIPSLFIFSPSPGMAFGQSFRAHVRSFYPLFMWATIVC